jgi:integrase
MSKKKLSKQISLGYDPMTGKRIRKRIYADTKAGLTQAEKDLIAEYARHGNPSTLTFGEYKEKWWNANVAHKAFSTQDAYKAAFSHVAYLEPVRMRDITRTDLQAAVNKLIHVPCMCRRVASILGSVWEAAVIDGVIEKNVALKLKRPKYKKSRRRALTEEELKAVREADLNPMERLFVTYLQQFGLRPGEAFALDRRALSKKDLTLTINKSVTYNSEKPVLKGTKTGVTRVLPVPASIIPQLQPVNNQLYLFTNEDGSFFTKTQARRFKERIIKKINMQMGGTDKIKKTDMTLYYFRHTRASQLYYITTVSTKAKAAYLGHSETMFLRIYSHMLEEKEEIEALREAVI